MNCTDINKLVKELAALVRFHELEAVDSKAAELLELADSIPGTPDGAEWTEENAEWIEEFRQANLVNNTR